jgi:hypothetical protein
VSKVAPQTWQRRCSRDMCDLSFMVDLRLLGRNCPAPEEHGAAQAVRGRRRPPGRQCVHARSPLPRERRDTVTGNSKLAQPPSCGTVTGKRSAGQKDRGASGIVPQGRDSSSRGAQPQEPAGAIAGMHRVLSGLIVETGLITNPESASRIHRLKQCHLPSTMSFRIRCRCRSGERITFGLWRCRLQYRHSLER